MKRWVELILDIALVVAAVATIPLVIAQTTGPPDPRLDVADWAVWAVFVVQFTIMLALAKNRLGYVRGNWLGPVVIVLSFPLLPDVLNLFRLAGLTRIVQLLQLPAATTRGARALRNSLIRPGVLGMLLVAVFLVLVGGGLLAAVEPQTVKGGFWTGLWWAMETVTTVGYGDIVPKTTVGRLVAVALMLGGIGVVATLAAAIASYFLGQGHDLGSLSDRLGRIERKIDALSDHARAGGYPAIPPHTPPPEGGPRSPGGHG